MRILQLHVDFIEYEPIKKEIEMAEEAEKKKVRYDNIVVVFVAAEKDDDISVAKKAMKEVKESLDVIKCNEVLIYPFAHLSSDLAKPSDALKVIKEMETEAKKLGLKTHRSPFGWNKQYSFKIKGHPMAEQGKTITSKDVKKEEEELVSKALKEEEKIVSHWHIMDIDGKLIPIKVDKGKVVGDFDFKKYPNLEKFALYELAKNREVTIAPPHIKMMREMEIADYEDASDSGNLRFYPKGRLIKSLLEEFVTKTVIDYGGMEVETPLMYSVDHPAAVAYLNKFPARQYIIKSGDREFFGRFSACFGQFCMADDMTISHKDLPVWLYELTRYSFRRERKSELAGLRRLRAFTMPDVHAFCKDIPQAIQEFQKRFKMSQETLDGIGFKKGEYELAVRFTKDFYKEHKDFIELLLRLHGKPALIEIWDKKVFYFVLKYEFNIVDALGKCSALSTDQIDIENSKNYGIRYIDENNKKKEVIILHCSPSGAIERDIYALLERAYLTEKSGGISQLPLWLSPTQIRLIPLSDDFVDFSKEVMQKLEKENIRVDVDDRQLTVQKRIRDAELEWVPFILVLGSREKDSGQFNIRIRSEKSKEVKMKLEELVKKIKDEVGDKPFKKLSLPKILSKRPIFVG
ncbi:MAG: threonine--tRNA ligase [Candidatus Aenigmarchaeota archaeon CG_4_10_14_0_8_um_filter_37_24]|nr:threonine--tRNA ligase [Candidatus Aenigmarchaeota archaeon]OIN88683.1 MAG: threonine--tRNA ligase [Candidatus Aenigmarchaeota archaeon CG1_02_38_14]PIW41285.1 MAG: threonine--tRNA ligase [Candidatus Aenigmarchaeota archaeon CG15_BIG_FIL_POST_REV_8_21_14_020_37_27]PIX50588.1 MAG: threonine--tRNA ligase [Candidatus Aenigmarchaeota archaeon CG_4_8_14_3_um_filter_37_24]PIY35488.1 MAG: threonine--tRNA ligase [Candidatus Aenigmarchaeota archaeon CG_4_10_14_3_um_filter_37_21]PIZ35785.1 MAG: threo